MATSTLEEILKRLASAPLPEPAAPVGAIGPLSADTALSFRAQNPEPVAPRFIAPAPVDMNAIDQRVGPAPTAPTIQQPNFLDKLAAVLGGVGAGFQGRGAEFAAGIRAEREAPFRRFEAQTADYTQRRDRAFEIAERRAEREAEQANRALEATYEREYRTWLSKNSDRSDEAKERVRQSFILERDARAARLQAEEEQRRDRRQQERDAQTIANQYFTATRNRGLSQELGRYHAGLTGGLSPAAARLDAAVQGVGRDRMSGATGGRARRGPTGEAQAAIDRFNLAKQAVIEAIQRGDRKAEQAHREAMNRAFKSLARFPRDVEIGATDPNWPYAKLKNSPAPTAAPQQQAPQQADPLGILR